MSLTDLADQANRNGVAELPISIYRPGTHRGKRWAIKHLSPLDQPGLIGRVFYCQLIWPN